MTTSVPPIQFTSTGLVVPDESAILAGMQADLNAAFGGKLNFGTTTQPGGAPPQVQLAASFAAIAADADGVIAELIDQVDPDNATGFMQDAIARIYFLNRDPGLPTVVQCDCVGALGTLIPVGAQGQDTSGNIYVCLDGGTIGASGTISLSFANIVNGPIPCPDTTLTKIYLAIPGWNTINNPAAGVLGANVESAADFEFRRQNSVAANGHGSLPSIYGEVFKVTGVIDLYAIENVTDAPIVVGSTNYTLVPHSLYVAVVGGEGADIANAIWTKKNEGSNMNGNTTVVVQDDSGYSFPKPTYDITFNRPTSTAYNFIVNIVNSSALPDTIEQDVQAAIAAQFNGTNGGTRARIGSLLLAASYYGPVATCEGPSVPVQVLSIFLGSDFSGHATLAVGSEVLTVTGVTSGSLSPGTVLTGTDIPDGATIVQQLTAGAPPEGGGTGTYQMSVAATGTVGAPEVITGEGGTAQQIGIDQAPVLGTVTVNLI